MFFSALLYWGWKYSEFSSYYAGLYTAFFLIEDSEPYFLLVFMQVFQKYHKQCAEAQKPSTLDLHLTKIRDIFSGPTIEEIQENLHADGSNWSADTLQAISQMSPTSLKITFKLLQLGSEMDLLEALKMEYRLSQRCCLKHDFIEGKLKPVEIETLEIWVSELIKTKSNFVKLYFTWLGVRALLIEKDHNPQWNPSTVAEVSRELVDSHFALLPEKEELVLWKTYN